MANWKQEFPPCPGKLQKASAAEAQVAEAVGRVPIAAVSVPDQCILSCPGSVSLSRRVPNGVPVVFVGVLVAFYQLWSLPRAAVVFRWRPGLYVDFGKKPVPHKQHTEQQIATSREPGMSYTEP